MVASVESEEERGPFHRFEDWYLSKSRIWLWTGLAIVVIGIFLGGTRDLNELALTSLVLVGISSGPSYQGAVTIDTLIQHSTEQLLLLGMSFLKLGIGGYIYTIVKNLESTSRHARNKLASDVQTPKTPFFRRLFPVLLVLGTDVQFFNVGVLMVIWDANVLNLLRLQFAGATTGVAYAQALMIEKVVGTLVVPVEMLGATLMLTGIPLGLASIVYNLRLQLALLPSIVWKAVTGEKTAALKGTRISTTDSGKGLVGKKTLLATLTALAIGASGLFVVSPFRVANMLGIVADTLSMETTTATYSSQTLFEKVVGMTTEQWLFIGLGLVILSVNLWLRQIIDGLERTREAVGKMLTSVTGTTITAVEKNLWPSRLGLPLALLGFGFMLANFAAGLGADSSFIAQSQAQAAGNIGTIYQQAVISGGSYAILAGTLKFVGFGLLLTAVGLNLVTIIINLKQTASTLLNCFPRIITFVASERRRPEAPGEIVLPPSMSLAPWRLIAIIVVGAVIALSAFFPFSLFYVQSFVQYETLGFASQTSTSGYASSFLAARLWEHTLLPLKLTGMGLMLFGIGRTFGTIVGYVKARTTVFAEFIDSIAALTTAQAGKAQTGAQTIPAIKPSRA